MKLKYELHSSLCFHIVSYTLTRNIFLASHFFVFLFILWLLNEGVDGMVYMGGYKYEIWIKLGQPWQLRCHNFYGQAAAFLKRKLCRLSKQIYFCVDSPQCLKHWRHSRKYKKAENSFNTNNKNWQLDNKLLEARHNEKVSKCCLGLEM